MIVWRDVKDLPLDDNDCLVIYRVPQISGWQFCCRAPVFYHDEKKQWIDEWGHDLDVIKYCLIPDL